MIAIELNQPIFKKNIAGARSQISLHQINLSKQTERTFLAFIGSGIATFLFICTAVWQGIFC